jgi:hypothetical protein
VNPEPINPDPIPESWREAYMNRPIAKLPGDLVKAYDELRAQRREINILRAQLFATKLKNLLLVGILGGAAAKGIEVGAMAIIHAFAR